MMTMGAGGQATITAKAAPLSKLVDMLSRQLNRPMSDQTGLKGAYDFTLKFASATGFAGAPLLPDPESVGNQSAPDISGGPGIFTALEEQLGLKLESRKTAVDVIVVAHIERPSEN